MVRKVWLWAGAGALGVLLAFFLTAGFGLMDGLSGGTLWVERMDGDEPTLTLDEARVRREQPELARTLDLAAAEGRATLEGEERARAGWCAIWLTLRQNKGSAGTPPMSSGRASGFLSR